MDAPDGTSYQDLIMAGMSREQVRIYRENAARQATESTRHASGSSKTPEANLVLMQASC